MLAVLLVSTYWGLGLGPVHGARERRWPSTSSTSRRPAGSRSPSRRTTSRWACSWPPPCWRRRSPTSPAPAPTRPSAGARRPTWRPTWRACCWAAPTSRRARLHRTSARAGAGAAVGDDRAAARRGRPAPPRPPAADRRRTRGDAPRPGVDRPAALARLRERIVPALEALLARRARPRRAAGRGRRDPGAAPLRLGEDGAAARRLARPAHPADRDRHRRHGGSARRPQRRGARRARRRASVEQAQRLSHLVDQLLDLSRLEAGTAEPRRELCSIEELVRGGRDEVGGRRSSSRSRSTATCRCWRPTPPSSSGRWSTCSRTPAATPAGTRSRSGRDRRRPTDDPDRRPRARHPVRRAASGSSSPSTGAPTTETTRAPASAWRSRGASSRPTTAG